MDCDKLAQKAIKYVKPVVFSAQAYAREGGRCPFGWEDEVELELTRPELIYLIRQHIGYDSLFKNYKEKEIDINKTLADIAHEEAWEYSISATVNNIIPEELKELSCTLESLNVDDEDAVKSVCNSLSGVSDGTYTFSFAVDAGDYNFADDASEGLDLTASEALGLLYGKHDIPKVFSKFNVKPLDEDFVNKKAEIKGFANDYDNFDYGGECEELENYLESWGFLLEQIYDEKIEEDELDSWMEYFEDSDNFYTTIEDWYDY